MRNIKNKFLIGLAIISIAITNLSFADANKDAINTNINNIIANINTDKTGSGGKIEILTNTVYDLSKDFSSMCANFGYDEKIILYLVSLGKLNSDYKKDLVIEFNALKNELEQKYAKNISDLNNIKDEINLSYTSLSSEQKAIYKAKIDNINADYNATNTYADSAISALKNKYTNNLNILKSNLASLINSNKKELDSIKDFDSKFSILSKAKEDLDNNYNYFKNNYLGGISTLTDFLYSIKNKYSELMKSQLTKMLDMNIEANPGLADYKYDLIEYITFLTNKFKLDLEKNMDDNYSIIYSQSKMDSINTNYLEFKTKYIDINGLVKANEFLTNSGAALNNLNILQDSISDLNSKLSNLSVSGTVNIENIKITLENQIIAYYNQEFAKNKQSLLTKLKENLKNLSVVNDLINTKYSSYILAVSSGATDDYFDKKTIELKAFLSKYENSSNSTIKKKIKKINYYLDNAYLARELENKKYKLYSYSKNKYEDMVNQAITKLDKDLGDDFVGKMDIVLSRIDTALTNTEISTSKRYKLLIIKKTIRDYIYKNKM